MAFNVKTLPNMPGACFLLLLLAFLVASVQAQTFYITMPSSSGTVFDGTCAQSCPEASPCTLLSGATNLSAVSCPNTTILSFTAGSVLSNFSIIVPSNLYGITSTGLVQVGALNVSFSGATLANCSVNIAGAGSLNLVNAILSNNNISNSIGVTGTLNMTTSTVNQNNLKGVSAASPLVAFYSPNPSRTGVTSGLWSFLTIAATGALSGNVNLTILDCNLSGFTTLYIVGDVIRTTISGTGSNSLSMYNGNLINSTLIGLTYINLQANIQIGTTPLFQGAIGSTQILGSKINSSYSVGSLPSSSWPMLMAPTATFLASATFFCQQSSIYNVYLGNLPSVNYLHIFMTTAQGPVNIASPNGPAVQYCTFDCTHVASSEACVTFQPAAAVNWASNTFLNSATCDLKLNMTTTSISTTFSVDNLCVPATYTTSVSMLYSSSFTITNAIAAGGSLNVTGAAGALELSSISIASGAVSLAGFPSFTYNMSNPNAGIVSASSNLTIAAGPTINVLWSQAGEPTPGTIYPFLTSSASLPPTLSFVNATSPGRNVTLSKSGNNYNLVFAGEQCNASCVSSNMATSVCSSTLYCVCKAPWAGPFCDCDMTDIPPGSGIICSPNGGKVWTATTTSLFANVTVPPGYTFEFQGYIYGSIVLNNSYLVMPPYGGYLQWASNGNQAEGALVIYSDLAQTPVGSSCVTYPTAGIRNATYIYLPTNIAIFLDATNVANSACEAMAQGANDAALISALGVYGNTIGLPLGISSNNFIIDVQCPTCASAVLNFSVFIIANETSTGVLPSNVSIGTPSPSLCTSANLTLPGTTPGFSISTFPCPSGHTNPVGEIPVNFLPPPVSSPPPATPISPTPTSNPPPPTSNSPAPVASTPNTPPAPSTRPSAAPAPSSSPGTPPSAPVSTPTAVPTGSSPHASTPSAAVQQTVPLMAMLALLCSSLLLLLLTP